LKKDDAFDSWLAIQPQPILPDGFVESDFL
jgi:hypothetical protein